MRTLVTIGKLKAQASLRPRDTSLYVTFVSTATGTAPCEFERQDLAELGTSKTLADQGTRGPRGPDAPEVTPVSLFLPIPAARVSRGARGRGLQQIPTQCMPHDPGIPEKSLQKFEKGNR